jgi:polysaccharide pyruvyl transferase CsaB
MRILVCGWVGSTNLGDEVVLAGVRAAIQAAFGPEASIAAVSTDPPATRASHGIAAIDHRRIDHVARAARAADLVILGGGGLIQDETSPFNLPYHLSRAWLASLGSTPWVGLALGVGRLDTALGRRLATTLRGAAAVTVRDRPSLELLADLGVPARLGADAAFHLAARAPSDDPEPELEGQTDGGREAIVVSLRPWSGPGGRLPVAWRRTPDGSEDTIVAPAAAALDRAARRTGLPIRLVAFQTDRDALLHERIATRMATPAELVVPDRAGALTEATRARIVVAMRYHAGIAAVLAGRQSVLVGYSPKVDALAGELGDGATHLPFGPQAFAHLDEAIVEQLARPGAAAAVTAARQRLIARTHVNVDVLLSAAGR